MMILDSIPNNKEIKFLTTLYFRPTQSFTWFRHKITWTHVGLILFGVVQPNHPLAHDFPFFSSFYSKSTRTPRCRPHAVPPYPDAAPHSEFRSCFPPSVSDVAPPARRATVPRRRAPLRVPLVLPSVSDIMSPTNSLFTAAFSKKFLLPPLPSVRPYSMASLRNRKRKHLGSINLVVKSFLFLPISYLWCRRTR
jgi:hypothetical protein